MGVFGNRATMRIFGLTGEEMRRGYRITHAKDVRISHGSLRITRGLKWRKIIMGGTCRNQDIDWKLI
jgi:hypothetical protein